MTFYAQMLFVSLTCCPPISMLALQTFVINYIVHCPSMLTGRLVESTSHHTNTTRPCEPTLNDEQLTGQVDLSTHLDQSISWANPPCHQVALISWPVESTYQNTWIGRPREPTLYVDWSTGNYWFDFDIPCWLVYGSIVSNDQSNRPMF